jgi:hypothetical protein
MGAAATAAGGWEADGAAKKGRERCPSAQRSQSTMDGEER